LIEHDFDCQQKSDVPDPESSVAPQQQSQEPAVASGVDGQSPSVHEARREPAAQPDVAQAISEGPQVMKPRTRKQGPLVSTGDPIELGIQQQSAQEKQGKMST